jgi:hypothetical protein
MVKMTDTIDEIFEDIWRQRQAAHGEEASTEPLITHCVYSRLFEASIQPICQKALQNLSIVSINQAMFLVFLSYMAYRETVPKSHRNHVGERGHRCIFHVLEGAFFLLKGTSLLVLPGETLFELPTPPQPIHIIKKYNYAGFELGETVVDDAEDE